MADFVRIEPEDFTVSPFKLLGKDWMLIAAEKDGRVNAMTASWGGLGVLWHRNVAFAVIRPQRFTKEFVDAADNYSLNFFDEAYRDKLSYFGGVSGRKEDKVAKSGFAVGHAGGAPYFEQARTFMTVRKLFAQPFRKESFVDAAVDAECYAKGDYHTLYIGEITAVMTRK